MVDDATFEMWGLEALVLSGKRQRSGVPGVGARRVLFSEVFGWVAAFPLPGAYGQMYGFADDLTRRLSDWHGTLIDPATA